MSHLSESVALKLIDALRMTTDRTPGQADPLREAQGCSACVTCGAPADWQEDAEDSDRLRAKMADLLTRTVNAIRGEPPPLTRWSWHDLPERAAAAIAALGQAANLAKDALAAAKPGAPAPEQFADAARLEWLMHHLSGAELRRIGVCTSGVGMGERDAIDAAIKGGAGAPADTGMREALIGCMGFVSLFASGVQITDDLKQQALAAWQRGEDAALSRPSQETVRSGESEGMKQPSVNPAVTPSTVERGAFKGGA